jgi:predicted MPP superfamily phosphohydrolase
MQANRIATAALIIALVALGGSTVQLLDPIVGWLGAGQSPTWLRLLGFIFALVGTTAALLAFWRKSPRPAIPLGLSVLALVTVAVNATAGRVLHQDHFSRVDEETVLTEAETLSDPSDDLVRIAFLGDSGDGTEAILRIGEYLAGDHIEKGLDAVVLLGDNIYNIPDDGWEARYEQTITAPFKPLFEANVPFYSVLGNHDFDNENVLNKMLADPRLNMNGERYFKVDLAGAGGIALLMVDAELAAVDTFQTYWLERRLEESQENWKLVICHKPAMSEHGGNPFVAAMLRTARLDAHGANLVMSGDDHNYQRHQLMPGVLQIVNGGASDKNEIKHNTDYRSIASYDERESFIIGEFGRDSATLRVINDLGAVVDSFTINP